MGSWSASVSTYTPKPGDNARNWLVIDAEDIILGRLAVQVATLLRGKHKPTFAPHMDGGDFVIVINAGKVALSGNKLEQKKAYSHSGYPGGLKSMSLGRSLEVHPERVVAEAVKGMMPHNKLSRASVKKLRVFAGSEHPYASQKPETFEIKQVAQ